MKENENIKKPNIKPFWLNIMNWISARTMREEDVMPASEAYVKATYGEKTNVEDQIKAHQHRINALIQDKIVNNYNRNNFSYRCVYSFPNDMAPYTDRVLQLFVDKGYQVINLSQRVEELKSDNVFLISWYKENL